MVCFMLLYISWLRSHSSCLLLSSLPFCSLNSFSLSLALSLCHVPVIADLYPCIKDHATHTKSRGLMSLPLTRSASRPLMRRAKGPSPMFTHSPPHALPQPLWKVHRQPLLFLSSTILCGSVLIIFTNTYCWHTDSQCAQLLTSGDPNWTCIWLRSNNQRFTCQLSSWVGLFGSVVQPVFWSCMLKVVMRMWVLYSVSPLLNHMPVYQCYSALFVSPHSEVDSQP